MAAAGRPLCRCTRLQLLLLLSKPSPCTTTQSIAKGYACRSFAAPAESATLLPAAQSDSSLPTAVSASLGPAVREEQKSGLSAETTANDELHLDLTVLRQDLEDYILSNTRSDTSSSSSSSSRRTLSGDATAGRSLVKYLPLLTSERLRVLPSADLLLLLHVYSKLLRCAESSASPARGEGAPGGSSPKGAWAAADEGRSLRNQALLFIARAADAIIRRPLDFLVHPQLTQVLAIASAFPPAAVPQEFWSFLLRRCADASRLVGPAESAGLLVGLAYLPFLPETARLQSAVSALCGRLAGAPEGLRHKGPLLQVLQALKRLQLRVFAARALQRRFASARTVSPAAASSLSLSERLEKEGQPIVSPDEGDKVLLIAGLSCFAAVNAREFQPLFRDLADALVKFVDGMTLHEAAEVFAALGALNCYPEKLLGALLQHAASILSARRLANPQSSGALTEATAPINRKDILCIVRILRAMGQLQKREVGVLREAAPLLVEAAQRDRLSLRDCVSVMYECYRLDLWHPPLAECLITRIRGASRSTLLEVLGLQGATNLLVALSYFRVNEIPLFEALLSQLLRHVHRLPTPAISQLQTVELCLRTGHLPFPVSSLSTAARDTLERARASVTEPECLSTSALQEKVAKTATFLQCHYYSEVALQVTIGPYTVDFAQPLNSEELEALQQEKHRNSRGRLRPDNADWCSPEELKTKAVVVEVDGPQHFYRDTLHWNSSSKLKHKLLSMLGFRIAHIPYYDVLPLTDPRDLREYVSSAVAHALRPARDLNIPGPSTTGPQTTGRDHEPHPSAEANAALNFLLQEEGPLATHLRPPGGDEPHAVPGEMPSGQTIPGKRAPPLPTSLKQQTREARLADPKKSLLIGLTRLRRRKTQEKRLQAQKQRAVR